jgi:hypothetical protein
MKCSALLLFGMFLVAAGAWAAAPESLIVPGESIGPVTMGMPLESLKQILTQLGSPLEETHVQDGTVLCYGRRGDEPSPFVRYLNHGGFCVFDFVGGQAGRRTPGMVAEIVTANTAFKTVEGLGPGSKVSAFEATFGAPSSVREQSVNESGEVGVASIMRWEQGIGLGTTVSKIDALIVFVFLRR